jgi:hypothetical protein
MMHENELSRGLMVGQDCLVTVLNSYIENTTSTMLKFNIPFFEHRGWGLEGTRDFVKR